MTDAHLTDSRSPDGRPSAFGLAAGWASENNKTNTEWACVGHGPTIWALGTKYEGRLRNIAASVERRTDGNWNWMAGCESGISPSRETAIQACESALPNTKDSDPQNPNQP